MILEMIPRQILYFFCVAGLAAATPLAVAQATAYEIDAHVYRIHPPDKDASPGESGGSIDATLLSGDGESGILIGFFDDVDIKLYGVDVTAVDGDLYWDGKRRPDHPLIEHIASPRITVAADEQAELRIGSDGVQFFSRDADEAYSLHTMESFVGFSFSCRIVPSKSDSTYVRVDYKATLKSVSDREPAEGTTLDIGKPRITTESSNGRPLVKFGQWYGVFQRGLEDSQVMMMLRVVKADADE